MGFEVGIEYVRAVHADCAVVFVASKLSNSVVSGIHTHYIPTIIV